MTVILHSNLETDLRLAAALDRELHMLLADMAGLRRSGALKDCGLVNGTGSDTKRVRFAGLAGTDAMSTTAAENTDEGTTAMTDASADIAVVRGSLRRDISDLASMTGFASDINPLVLAQSMVISSERWFNSLVATAIAGASTDVGTSTVDASFDDWMDGIYTLEIASAPGPYAAILHPRQWADLQESLRGETGPVQFLPAVQAAIAIKGQGYVGSLAGVDVFLSTDVTSSGGNRHGAMFGHGALGYAAGVPLPVQGGATEIRSGDAPILVEIQRDSSAATTEVVGHAYYGASLLEQGRIVGFVTDA